MERSFAIQTILMCSFNKCLLSTSCVLVIVLSHGETAGKKTSVLMKLTLKKVIQEKEIQLHLLEKCHWRPH